MALEPSHVLALLLVVAVFVALLTAWWVGGRTGRRNQWRNRIARRGETDAERLLYREGFTIEARQVTGRWTMVVDGEPIDVSCRADLIVRRRRRRFVAEVKSGAFVADPTRPQTRRQLLEYRLAFDVDGLLLVDMVHGRVREVVFPTG